jgi:hypothetical protein
VALVQQGLTVSAAETPAGLWVRFRVPTGGTSELLPRVEATGGSVAEVVISPDRRTVAALWRDPAGVLRCRYPSGAVGQWWAGDRPARGAVDYVFFEDGTVSVTGSLPRGCTMLPAIELRIAIAAPHLPGTVQLPGGVIVPLRRSPAIVRLVLPRTSRGRLEQGDLHVAVETAGGERRDLLVAVDPDGTPAATSGYAANW